MTSRTDPVEREVVSRKKTRTEGAIEFRSSGTETFQLICVGRSGDNADNRGRVQRFTRMTFQSSAGALAAGQDEADNALVIINKDRLVPELRLDDKTREYQIRAFQS